jgi:hypothetical protein
MRNPTNLQLESIIDQLQTSLVFHNISEHAMLLDWSAQRTIRKILFVLGFLILTIIVGCTKSTPSPTAESTPPTITSTVGISKQCLTVQDDVDQAITAEGHIVLYGINILHLPTREENPLPKGTNDILSNPSVSPDGKSLAYIHTEYDEDWKFLNSHLLATTAEGVPQAKIPWTEGWGAIWGWLDNSRLLILPIDRPPGTMILLDPFASTRQELMPTFPDVYAQKVPTRWENFTVVIYEPSLEKVVYLRDTFSEEGLGIVLWDLQSNRELWQLSHTSAEIVTPKWSPDGEKLTVAEPTTSDGYHFEILSVDSQGKVTQLTNLTSIYSVTLIGDFNRSPDGRFIAFWFEDRPSPQEGDGLERLLVLDTRENKITDYCIPGSVLGSARAPIWSPDGRYIVVENIYEANSSRVILVDIQENMAWQIAENQRPAGWMTEED